MPGNPLTNLYEDALQKKMVEEEALLVLLSVVGALLE